MNTIENLLAVADAYKRASGIEFDRTVSHRVFGDSKKLSALRTGSDITLRRYNDALLWFSENWPEQADRHEALANMVASPDAA
tara:strand:- start:52466 stop:52714 length:249 start_codon:yes stop_codon:yes gene_type:complete